MPDIPDDVLDAFTSYAYADDEPGRVRAVARLTEYESTLPPGQQAFFRVKVYTVLATPLTVQLEQEVARGEPPRDPKDIAISLIDGMHQGFASDRFGQSGEWLARAVSVQQTYQTLARFSEECLRFAREKNEGGNRGP